MPTLEENIARLNELESVGKPTQERTLEENIARLHELEGTSPQDNTPATWGDTVSSLGRSVQLGAVKTVAGASQFWDELNVDDPQKKADIQSTYGNIQDLIEKDIQSNTPKNQTFMQEAVTNAVSSVATNLPLVAGAYATGGGSLVPLGGIALQSFADAYGSARQAGKDASEATNYALRNSAGEAIPEILPFHYLTKPLSAVKGKVIKNLAKYFGAELVGESVSTASQDLNDYFSGMSDKTTVKEALQGIAHDMPMTWVTTVLAGGVTGGAVAIGQKLGQPTEQADTNQPPDQQNDLSSSDGTIDINDQQAGQPVYQGMESQLQPDVLGQLGDTQTPPIDQSASAGGAVSMPPTISPEDIKHASRKVDYDEQGNAIVRTPKEIKRSVEDLYQTERFVASSRDNPSKTQKYMTMLISDANYKKYIKPLDPNNPKTLEEYRYLHPTHTHMTLTEGGKSPQLVAFGAKEAVMPTQSPNQDVTPVKDWTEPVETKPTEPVAEPVKEVKPTPEAVKVEPVVEPKPKVEPIAPVPPKVEKPVIEPTVSKPETPAKKPKIKLKRGEKVYSITDSKEGTIEVVGYPVKSIKELDVFVYKAGDEWKVTEATTGLNMGKRSATKGKAMALARKIVKEMPLAQLKETISTHPKVDSGYYEELAKLKKLQEVALQDDSYPRIKSIQDVRKGRLEDVKKGTKFERENDVPKIEAEIADRAKRIKDYEKYKQAEQDLHNKHFTKPEAEKPKEKFQTKTSPKTGGITREGIEKLFKGSKVLEHDKGFKVTMPDKSTIEILKDQIILTPEGGEAYGSIKVGKDSSIIKLDTMADLETVEHELRHFAYRKYMTKHEVKRAINQYGSEEKFAQATKQGYPKWISNNTVRKVYDFLLKIKDLLINSVGKTERMIKSGEIFKREGKVEDTSIAFKDSLPSIVTDKFKKWFGDSKVVDDKGNPLVVYHGTSSLFETFKIPSKGTNSNIFGSWDVTRNVAFFAEDKELAREFATQGERENPQILSVYLSIQNELDLTTQGFGVLPESFFKKNGLNPKYYYNLAPWETWQAFDQEESGDIDNSLVRALKKEGYDGIKQMDVSEGSIENTTSWAVFSPTQIKSQFNKGEWSTTDPRIAYQRKYDPRVEAIKNRLSEPDNRTLKEKLVETATKFKQTFRQGALDQFDSFRTVLNDKRAWMMAHLTKSHTGVVHSIIHFGIPYMKENAVAIRENTKGLKDTFKPLQGEVDDFLLWVAGHRSQNLKTSDETNYQEAMQEWESNDKKGKKPVKESRENFLQDEEIKALQELNQGKMEDGKSREEVYAKVLKDFEAINNGVVDFAVANGTVNKTSAKIWRDEGMYVPFYRVLEEGEHRGVAGLDKLVRQTAFKRLKGSDKPFDDLLTNVLQNWNHLIQSGLNNQSAVQALNTAEEMGIATQVEESKRSKDATFVRKNGEEVWYEVDEPLVLEALSGLNRADLTGKHMDVMRAFKRLLTTGVTASPDFKLRNLFRDTLQAIAVAPMSVNIFKNLVQGYRATKAGSKTDVAMKSSGAGFTQEGYIHGGDPDAMQRMVDAGIDEDTLVKHPKEWLKQVWEAWQDFGARLENVNRAASFEQSQAKGKDLLESAFEARDQLDFSRTGAWTTVRWLAQVVPFLNARMQGVDKIARASVDPKQKAQFRAVAGTYSLITVAIYLAMKDDKDFKERDDWERDTYIFLKLSRFGLPPVMKDGKELMFALPKPFEVGVIGTFAERFAEQFADDKVHGDLFAERLWFAVTQTLSVNPVPQMFMPVGEIYANKSTFTGRAIEPQSLRKLKPTERKRVWTSQTAVGASYLMNKVSWDEVTLSPLQIEHLVKGYMGWLGGAVLWGTDLIADPLMDKPISPARRLDRYPITRSFVRESPARFTRYGKKFYENMHEINQIMATISTYRKMGEFKKLKELAVEEKDKIRFRKYYQKTARRLTKIRRLEKRIYLDKDLSATVKRNKIDKLIIRKNQILEQAIAKMDF